MKSNYSRQIYAWWVDTNCEVCEKDITFNHWCYNEIETNNYLCNDCYQAIQEPADASI